MSHAFDYATRKERRWPPRWPARLFVAAIVFSVGAFALTLIPVQKFECVEDSVTGSQTHIEVSFFGTRSVVAAGPTPLEVGLKKRGIPWTPTFQPSVTTGY